MTKLNNAKAPLAWMAVGWVLAMLYVLGPRAALNRGLDVGYSVAGFFGSLF